MITKEQLQAMSDGEVNAALASIVHKKIFTQDEIKNLIDIAGIPCNYCNTPNDIMPLAFEHKVCLISPHSHTKVWSARQTDGGGLWSVSDYFYLDKNPLRAISCCLILVLQEKQK